jgi:hypothetical protein
MLSQAFFKRDPLEGVKADVRASLHFPNHPCPSPVPRHFQ